MLSRRMMLAGAGAACAGWALPGRLAARDVPDCKPDPVLTPDQALQRLRDGNALFAANSPIRRDTSRKRREALFCGQNPFATIVCCSDSRVPPELVFGQALGELFVVRDAGNVVDTMAMGSIEYSVGKLGVPLILVLGHQRCGAVDAAIDVAERGTPLPGSIERMILPILPAVLVAKRSGAPDLPAASVRANVRQVAADLRRPTQPVLGPPLAAGKLRVVGAVYTLEPGTVDFFDLG